MKTIIVGADESDGAAEALEWAAREADVRGAGVVAVLAWGFLDQHSVAGFHPDYDDKAAEAALDAIVESALKPEEAAKVERRAICGLPAGVLLDESRDADMLVVGARGLGGFRGLLLGSISQQCLHHATVPTVVVRHHAEPGVTRRIVVGIDGSSHSQQALEWAVDAARVHGADLTVIHAYELPYVGGYPYATMTFDPAVFSRAAKNTMSRAMAAVDHAGVQVQDVVTRAGAAPALLSAAGKADLVVVGSRGLGVVKRLVLGSVADQVARHAPCPVVVIPDVGGGSTSR